jgi:hypothetical protein
LVIELVGNPAASMPVAAQQQDDPAHGELEDVTTEPQTHRRRLELERSGER